MKITLPQLKRLIREAVAEAAGKNYPSGYEPYMTITYVGNNPPLVQVHDDPDGDMSSDYQFNPSSSYENWEEEFIKFVESISRKTGVNLVYDDTVSGDNLPLAKWKRLYSQSLGM